MTQLNFYQIDDDPIIKSIVPLLIKILGQKEKTLIFCQSEQEISQIDNALWNFGRDKFIPHATILDKNFDLKKQPIIITNQEQNANDATMLVFTYPPSENFLKNFTRSFYFFEEGNCQSNLKPNSFYKKINGKWVK